MKEQETKTLGRKRRQVVFPGGKKTRIVSFAGLYTVRDKPNRVVIVKMPSPYRYSNMREKETKSVSGKIDKERTKKKNK